jgi:hypothetical protein
MFTRTRARSAGFSGGGSTCATASGSLSQTATTPVDQMSGSTARLYLAAWMSASLRGPYRTRAMTEPPFRRFAL